jgi:response regulator RpfG family c-di-GMP phosphodiesterase
MALRILMTGDDQKYLKVDGEMLRQRGFRVYICEKKQIIDELIDEVKPDIIFINSRQPDKNSTDIYHQLIDNVIYASLPVIFTLSEDDVYLVNRKRTATRERRYIMSDSIVDAIKMAMNRTPASAKKRIASVPAQFASHYTANRA